MSVAGTPLPLPRETCVVTDPRDGLTATVTLPFRSAWSQLDVSLGARRASFRCNLGSAALGEARWGSLRALLLERRLLTRPGLVTGRDSDADLDGDARALLRDLREAWRRWADNQFVSCDACNARSVRRAGGWFERVPCDHVDLWSRAWALVADTQAELVFATVGVLALARGPDGALRWVLTRDAHEGALAALFDASSGRSMSRSPLFGATRRWSRPRRRVGEGRDPLDEARRFAAAAWGDPSLADAAPPSLADASTEITLDEDDAAPVPVAVLLPESSPPTPPPRQPSTAPRSAKRPASEPSEPKDVGRNASERKTTARGASGTKKGDAKKGAEKKGDAKKGAEKKGDAKRGAGASKSSGSDELLFTDEELREYFPADLVKRELAAGRLVQRPDGRYVFRK